MTMQTAPQGAQQTATYQPPQDAYADWARNECRDFVPDARQSLVIKAVQAALAAGRYYTNDVQAFCAEYLGVGPELQQSKGPIRNEGGIFGMDCYYARNYLRAREKFAMSAEAMSQLKPYVGQKLGSIVFNDYKRTTGAVVIAVFDQSDSVRISGKRGAQTIEATVSVADYLALLPTLPAAQVVRSTAGRGHTSPEESLQRACFEWVLLLGVEQAVVSSTAISITADQAGYSCPGRTAHMG